MRSACAWSSACVSIKFSLPAPYRALVGRIAGRLGIRKMPHRHCEERSDDPSTLAAQASPGLKSAEARRAKAEAIQLSCCGKTKLDCFASLAMTVTTSVLAGLLHGRHHNLDDVRRFEIDADASAHRRVLAIDPLIPSPVHLGLALDVGDIDDRREDSALVRAAQREAFVDTGERLHALLIHRGSDRIGSDRDGENKIVVRDRAAAGGCETGKARDHGLPPFLLGYSTVIASEAKQSSFASAVRMLDCFVASLLAMTVTMPCRCASR